MIHTDDHEPEHVHVYKDNGFVKIGIAPESAEILVAKGLKPAEIKKAREIVTQHRDMLLEEWERIHGDN
ncbi:MAG TPA: DUF4160 domain-containing protein [Armatimonadota bacterium]|nr:DUF4160 domain-containing protein [Armatimonadota bacterium]